MRFLFSFFLMIFVASCDFHPEAENSCVPDRQTLITAIRRKTCLELQAEKELYACGYSGGGVEHIRETGLSFLYHKEPDIAQGRDLLMTAADILLNHINEDEQIRPLLKNYPFLPENIEIVIFLREPKNAIENLDRLTVIEMVNGVLKYKSAAGPYRLKTVHTESYAEARTILDRKNSEPKRAEVVSEIPRAI